MPKDLAIGCVAGFAGASAAGPGRSGGVSVSMLRVILALVRPAGIGAEIPRKTAENW